MMRTEYSQQAQTIHTNIYNLNDSLQRDIDNFYYDTIGIEDIELNLKDINYKILSKLESLNDLLINYLTYGKYTLEIYSKKSEFQLSNNLEELLGNYLDVINYDLSTLDLPKVTNEVIIKYINMNIIYENMMNELNDIDMFNNYCDKRLYSKENIITILDLITDEFYDYIDNIKLVCISEKNIFNMIRCYMLNLKIVLYLIEFIESIKYIR